ncbi:hypothetical protein RJ639_013425 [Escallonia herrerae]|uniref:Inositol-phosphate phosphatase n=1 Tax=Escallonia herrerae TaxID=1293975 RepID=A0AA89APC9_9ASTE|nr:hypothetical protein RJ639_013425 [Escallonia herrerae]
MSEAAILEVVRKNFGDHLILGEEGGLIGDSSSDYLWCIDPLDGTTNFAHGYPSFAVSVGVLFRGKPAAAAVVEFVGGPMCWNSRIFSAASGGGAFCNGQKVHVSQTDKSSPTLGYGIIKAIGDLCGGFVEVEDATASQRNLQWTRVKVRFGKKALANICIEVVEKAFGNHAPARPWDLVGVTANFDRLGSCRVGRMPFELGSQSEKVGLKSSEVQPKSFVPFNEESCSRGGFRLGFLNQTLQVSEAIGAKVSWPFPSLSSSSNVEVPVVANADKLRAVSGNDGSEPITNLPSVLVVSDFEPLACIPPDLVLIESTTVTSGRLYWVQKRA